MVWSYCEVLRAFINNVKQMRRGEKDGVQGGWRGECRTGQSHKKISECERLERQREATALKSTAGFRKSEGSRCLLGRCWLDANELRRSIEGADNLLSTTRPSEQLYKGFLWSSGASPKITLASPDPTAVAPSQHAATAPHADVSPVLVVTQPITKKKCAGNRRTCRVKVWTCRRSVGFQGKKYFTWRKTCQYPHTKARNVVLILTVVNNRAERRYWEKKKKWEFVLTLETKHFLTCLHPDSQQNSSTRSVSSQLCREWTLSKKTFSSFFLIHPNWPQWV